MPFLAEDAANLLTNKARAADKRDVSILFSHGVTIFGRHISWPAR